MPKVLYAEDDTNMAAIVREYLAIKAPEFSLEVVPDGRACLQRMEGGGYDVLLVDLMLPDIDGLQIITELAARGDTTPAVVISSHGQNELAVRALRAGAVDCIDKSTSQVLEVGTIIRQIHARQSQAALAARHVSPLPGRRQVVCMEASSANWTNWKTFFRQQAPHLEVIHVPSRGDFADLVRSERRIDAVVLGPNLDGAEPLDFLRQLRSLGRQLPVVVVTRGVDSDMAVAAIKLGACDVLREGPFCLPDLIASLTAALRQSELERINRALVDKLERSNQLLEAEVARRTSELVVEIEVRKEAQARLAALSSRLLRLQENERRAIARELHDHVGQTLTGLKLQLERLGRQFGDPALTGELATIAASARQLLTEVRTLSQQLRPQILDDLGMQPAIEWHANLFTKQTGIVVNLDISLPAARLEPDLEVAAFRVIQEALTNVARHSGAGAAEVSVTASSASLHVEVSDRGRGFDVAAARAARDSVGLSGMQERVSLAGGLFEIVSELGKGTRLHAEFPLGTEAGNL